MTLIQHNYLAKEVLNESFEEGLALTKLAHILWQEQLILMPLPSVFFHQNVKDVNSFWSWDGRDSVLFVAFALVWIEQWLEELNYMLYIWQSLARWGETGERLYTLNSGFEHVSASKSVGHESQNKLAWLFVNLETALPGIYMLFKHKVKRLHHHLNLSIWKRKPQAPSSSPTHLANTLIRPITPSMTNFIAHIYNLFFFSLEQMAVW